MKKQRMKKLAKSLPATGIALLAILSLAACTQDEMPGTDGTNGDGTSAALHITSARLKAPEVEPLSRAAADVLTTGSIGLFRSKGTGYAETQDNKKYTYDAAKGWQPAAVADTIYLMANNADVCAYYPYNAAYTDKTAIPLASGKYTGTADDLTKHDPADLCYASNRAMNGATASTELVMQHAMALVQLTFERDNYASTACNLMSVSIKNKELISTSTVNITDGTYGTTPAKAALKWTPGEGASATGIQVPETGTVTTSALLVPCTLDAATGTTFSFTVDGQTMSAKVPAARLAALEAGKIHKLKFLVHASSITLSEVSIVDWWREWDTANEPTVEAGTKDYIELAGVKWALADLAYNPTYYTYSFAASAVVSGTKMQWNALTGTDEGNKTDTWFDYQDPCTRIEPKGTWVTPRKEDVDSLLTVPRAWTDDYQGVRGWWFGINDAAKAAQSPDRYLFLSAGIDAGSYWMQTYGTKGHPYSFWIMKNTLAQDDLVEYHQQLNVRCIKKPSEPRGPIDIGLDFLIAPGNLVAEGSLDNVTGYRFADEQGWFSGDYANGGDYFCYGTTDPFVSKGIASNYADGKYTGPFVDPCKEMGGTWRTPTGEELGKLINWEFNGWKLFDPPVTNRLYGTYTYLAAGGEKTVNGWWCGTSEQPTSLEEQKKYVFLPLAGGITQYTQGGSTYTGYWSSYYIESAYGTLAMFDHSVSGSNYDAYCSPEAGTSGSDDTKAPIRCVCDRP